MIPNPVKSKRENKLKVGDVVKNFGIEFKPSPWYLRMWHRICWSLQDLRYWIKDRRFYWKHGFKHVESYDLKSALPDWLLPRIKHFRENLMGHPSDFGSIEEWKAILDSIIWSCEHYDDHVDPIYPPNYDRRQIVVRADEKGTAYRPVDTRPIDWTPVEEHEKKVREGFELLGRYLHTMWN